MLPQKTTTVEQLIASGNGVMVSYDNLAYIDVLSNGTKICTHNVINDYIDEFKSLAVDVELNDSEYRKYCYKPKLLCYDLYGNTEVYYIILLINNIADMMEFDKRRFKMLKVADMNSILTSIFNAEQKGIDDYNTGK